MSGHKPGGRDGGGGGANRIQEILAMCPESMGSGLLVDDTESGGRQRQHAAARIKGMLGQVKANIKVGKKQHLVLLQPPCIES